MTAQNWDMPTTKVRSRANSICPTFSFHGGYPKEGIVRRAISGQIVTETRGEPLVQSAYIDMSMGVVE